MSVEWIGKYVRNRYLGPDWCIPTVNISMCVVTWCSLSVPAASACISYPVIRCWIAAGAFLLRQGLAIYDFF